MQTTANLADAKLTGCLTYGLLTQALGPQPPGGLPIETQENTGFIKKVAEKLHIRSRETDPHPQHRRTEARAWGLFACRCLQLSAVTVYRIMQGNQGLLS